MGSNIFYIYLLHDKKNKDQFKINQILKNEIK